MLNLDAWEKIKTAALASADVGMDLAPVFCTLSHWLESVDTDTCSEEISNLHSLLHLCMVTVNHALEVNERDVRAPLTDVVMTINRMGAN